MDAFNPTPPNWIAKSTHALKFCCPACAASPMNAQQVWINRRAPVRTENLRIKWQEFYWCECGQVWWAWNSDRPPQDFNSPQGPPMP